MICWYILTYKSIWLIWQIAFNSINVLFVQQITQYRKVCRMVLYMLCEISKSDNVLCYITKPITHYVEVVIVIRYLFLIVITDNDCVTRIESYTFLIHSNWWVYFIDAITVGIEYFHFQNWTFIFFLCSQSMHSKCFWEMHH